MHRGGCTRSLLLPGHLITNRACSTLTQVCHRPDKNNAVSCISSHFQTKRSSYNEVKCFNTDLYGENTTIFFLYFDIKNSRHELYEFQTHNKNPQ